MKKFLCFVGLSFLMLACSNHEMDPVVNGDVELCFKATMADAETRTVHQNDGRVFWSPGDAVSLFFNNGDKGGARFVAQNASVAEITEFRGTIDGFSGSGESYGGEYWFWSVYPYSEENSCDGASITTVVLSAQTAKAGSFDNGLFPTMARAKGLELAFYNICSGIKFSVSRDDIKMVKFKGNANENLAGKIRVGWDSNGLPAVQEYVDGKKEVTVTAPGGGTFVPGQYYYIVFCPTTLSQGFSLTYYTNDNKQGEFNYGQSRQFKRGIFTVVQDKDSQITSWTDAGGSSGQSGAEGGTESGLYLGISTFDREYQYYPAHLISEETLESYNSIINGLELTTLNNTLLYYSIDEDITAMQQIQLPSDLFSVSLVTFTDGLDEGSLGKRRGVYRTKAEYLNALYGRLRDERVSGIAIKSFAIGLKGPDAQSNPTEFQNNLEKIASTPQNSSEQYVYEISDINQLNSTFQSIADQLNQDFRVQKIVVTIPYTEHGERERFVLDNKEPRYSKKYIEGVLDTDNLQLTDVVYYGVTSTSGSVVPISGDFITDLEFTFEGIQTTDGTLIERDNIYQWYIPLSSTNWQLNTEFTPDENAEVYTEVQSALVILNLDLSKSLAGQLPSLKAGAKSFISKLYTSSVDPDVVRSAKLNKTIMDLGVGKSETLQVTVSPSTASASSLRWASSSPTVATVTQSGKVTGVSEGTTIVTVSTESGKELASCVVTVRYKHVESVSLSKSSIELYVGKTATLTATVSPSDAVNPAITWSSSKPDVATVSSSGVVTAIKKGTASLTATSVDGGKSATCTVSVVEFVPSSTPRDMTLAVSLPTGGRYFLTKNDLQYVNLDNYVVEGLYVVGLSGFIISLQDASTNTMCYEAANSFFYLPDGDQGMAISSRFSDINNALTQFGGKALKSSYDYYWTTERGSSTSEQNCINGRGGALISLPKTSYCYVREVIPLSFESPWVPTLPNTGLFLAASDGNSRVLLSSVNDIPTGFSAEGLAVSAKGIHIIMALSDASSDRMNYSSASALYGTRLPDATQAKLISARFSDINNALTQFGGSVLKSSYDYYWTTKQGASSSEQYCINGSGGILISLPKTSTNYVRLVLDPTW